MKGHNKNNKCIDLSSLKFVENYEKNNSMFNFKTKPNNYTEKTYKYPLKDKINIGPKLN